ncbi:MAG TPA: Rieske 2Fe-2S domain-containing protein, partial [Bryobacteraceae bacterium]|nr:Rieske 2Fe-2S domain-containing protein [Bryobacteraceae bacterium]
MKQTTKQLWREEFSVFAGEDRYVQRRQFAKFLVLTSVGMFVGNLWILVRSWFRQPSCAYPEQPVAHASEIPVGEVKLFSYPNAGDRCILVHSRSGAYTAFSQKCTHLSCAVYYSAKNDRLECPCHEGYFSVADGSVLQGPPPRPLPRVKLEKRGDELFAIGMEI